VSLTIGSVIDAEIARGTLEPAGIATGVDRGDIVYHHEWAKTDDSLRQLCCVMWAGFGGIYIHNLDAKTIDRTMEPLAALGLHFMDTD